MANYASVTVTLTGLPTLGDQFTIISGFGNISLQCVQTRTQAGQFSIQTSIADLKTHLINCIIADYGINPWSVTGFISPLPYNKLGLTAFEYGFTFELSVGNFYNTSVIQEDLPANDFKITGITVTPADADNNTKAKFTVQLEGFTPGGTVTITNPINQTFTDPTNVSFDYLRFPVPPQQVIIIDDTTGYQATQGGEIFNGFLPYITIWEIYPPVPIQNTQGNFTVPIAKNAINGDEPINQLIWTNTTYSLDGVNYQPSNIFQSVLPGDYTVYLLDDLGGIWTRNFTVTGFDMDKPEPFFDISRVNPIHFTNNANTGNFFSRFDRQKFINIEFQNFAQDFKLTDAITTQIRSNYETITAQLRDECTSEIIRSFTVNEKINNLNKQDKRDCYVMSSGLNTTYVYFTSGNIYDPTNDNIIGSFNLNSSAGVKLEPWMQQGVKIELFGAMAGNYEVYAVEFITGLGYVLVIDTTYTGLLYNSVCTITYNLEIFNIHEFITNFTALDTDKKYNILVSATDTDPRYNDVAWVSEPIEISDCEKTFELKYYTANRTIGNIDPLTGIIHLLRIPGRFYKYGGSQEVDIFTTDSANKRQLKRTNAIIHSIETGFIPPYLADKIGIALTHDNVVIDGLQYVPTAESEIKDRTSENNPLVELTCEMQYNDTIVNVSGSGIVSGRTGDVLGVTTKNVLGV